MELAGDSSINIQERVTDPSGVVSSTLNSTSSGRSGIVDDGLGLDGTTITSGVECQYQVLFVSVAGTYFNGMPVRLVDMNGTSTVFNSITKSTALVDGGFLHQVSINRDNGFNGITIKPCTKEAIDLMGPNL
jgi:hypothetical protein